MNTDPELDLSSIDHEHETIDLERLHRALRVAAEADDLLDVAVRTIDTPVGKLLLAATAAGLVRVAYAIEGHADVLADLSRRISPRVLRSPERLDAVAVQLDEYFSGNRRHFTVALDMRLASGFRRDVLTHLSTKVDYGYTASYARVAVYAGHPGAARAVGTACARNPLPVVVPCHRVVRADGSIGEYIGGGDAKQTLLDLEAAT